MSAPAAGLRSLRALSPALAPPGDRGGVLRALAVYAASRAATVAVGAWAARRSGQALPEALGGNWDGGWYERIVLGGYPATLPPGSGPPAQSAHAFFPAYPLLVRALRALVPLPALAAAVVVSLAAGALAVLGVRALAERVAGPEAAGRAAVLFCLSPGAFVLSFAYAEAVMLAASAACLLFLVRRRWAAAGLAGAVATAARPNAVVLVACCAWAAAGAWGRGDRRALVAPALASLGVLAWFAYLWRRTGVADAWFRVERQGWDQRLDFGRRLAEWAEAFVRQPAKSPDGVVFALGFVLAVAGLAFLSRARLPGVLNVYALGVLALTLLSNDLPARPRFVFTAFPLLVATARQVRGGAFVALAAAGAAWMLALTAFYAHSKALGLVPP